MHYLFSMKTFILSLLLLGVVTVHAQTGVDFSLGYIPEAGRLSANLGIEHTFHNGIYASYQQVVPLSTCDIPAFFQLRAGYNFKPFTDLHFVLATGYALCVQSAGKVHGSAVFSGQMRQALGDNMMLKLEVQYLTAGYVIPSVGVVVMF